VQKFDAGNPASALCVFEGIIRYSSHPMRIVLLVRDDFIHNRGGSPFAAL